MRDLDVLHDLASNARAANAAAKERAAHAGKLVILEIAGNTEPDPEELETYEQLAGSMTRILGIAGELAALAIDPKKVEVEDVGKWFARSDLRLTGRLGCVVYSRGPDERLWLNLGKGGGLAQQRYDPSGITQATYPSDVSAMKDAWEVSWGEGFTASYGPFELARKVTPYMRYCGVQAVANAFFAFIDTAGVLDTVEEGVARKLAPAEETQPHDS